MDKSLYTGRSKRFCELLIAARKTAGLTQTELAKRIGVDQVFISKYENGDRRLDVLEFLTIAEASNINPASVMQALKSIS
ncbi:helix-turn-helix transcriptional regulator [Microvirga sp. Marseille-Q2068]|uniref:Helix-turn-helix transcriptional regulator n=2 Tax=Microvirga mediterraneensis TaxID=2754695 RepID=A0A838BSP6_9HYPH|nr:helix-turn-helix transcriptional regulator [Microvirga mediterraneensis]